MLDPDKNPVGWVGRPENELGGRAPLSLLDVDALRLTGALVGRGSCREAGGLDVYDAEGK